MSEREVEKAYDRAVFSALFPMNRDDLTLKSGLAVVAATDTGLAPAADPACSTGPMGQHPRMDVWRGAAIDALLLQAQEGGSAYTLQTRY